MAPNASSNDGDVEVCLLDRPAILRPLCLVPPLRGFRILVSASTGSITQVDSMANTQQSEEQQVTEEQAPTYAQLLLNRIPTSEAEVYADAGL